MLAGMSDENEETPSYVETEVEITTEPPPASEPEPEAVAAEPEAEAEPVKAKPVRQAGTGHPRHNVGPAPRLPRN